ncbi:MAG: hypothetical protein WEG36_16250 [Gemmatimonadota bacterium]
MKIAIQIFLTIALTWLIVSQVGVTLDEFASPGLAAPALNPAWLALGTVLLLAGYLVTARLWGRMVGELGGIDPGGAASIRIVLTANLGRYLPGKFWQMAGLALLAKRYGGSATLGATAGVLSHIFALAATGLVALPLLAGPSAPLGRARIPVLMLLALLAFAVAVPRVLHRVFTAALRVARLPAAEVVGMDGWFGARWLAMHLVVWIIYSLAFISFVRGLGFEAGFAGFAAPFAAAYLLGYLAIFAPAGIGVRDGFLIAFLRPEVGGAAVGIALFARVWMTLAELLPAGFVAMWELFRGGGVPTGSGETRREVRDGEPRT